MDSQPRHPDPHHGSSSKHVSGSSEPSVPDPTGLTRPQGMHQDPASQSLGSLTSPTSTGHVGSPSPQWPASQDPKGQAQPWPAPQTPGNESLTSPKKKYAFFTAEEKAYLVHRQGFIDNAALTDEFNRKFSCSRTPGSIYQVLYHLRSDPVTKQSLAESAKSFEWYIDRPIPQGFTQEHKAFIVYQTSHGQRRKDVIIGLDREFSLNRLDRHIQRFLKSLDNESAQALLVEAQKYEWFKTAPPPYDSMEFELGTFNWSAEQRAYIMILHDRGGITKPTILSRLNSKFNINCEMFELSRQLCHLSHTGKKAALLDLASKYDWWTPEPMPGEKGYAKMERKIKLVDARARKDKKKSEFDLMMRENNLNEEEEGNGSAWYPQSPHQTTWTSLSSLNSPAGPVHSGSAIQDSVLRESDDEEFDDDEDIDEEREVGPSSHTRSGTCLSLSDTRSANINRTGSTPQESLSLDPSHTRPDSSSEGYASHPGYSRECTSSLPDFLNPNGSVTPGVTPLQATNQLGAERGSRALTPMIQISPLHQMSFPSSQRVPSASRWTSLPGTPTNPHRDRS